VWQNLDPARFAAATGLAVLPVVLEELDGPHDGLARDWPRPDVGSEKHRIYMMQWYAFAALAVALWIGLAWRHRR
jgi:cytochrome oxidase assembly protein ShyY1